MNIPGHGNTEAVSQRCYVKKLFWKKNRKIHGKTPVSGPFFNEVAGSRFATLLKKRLRPWVGDRGDTSRLPFLESYLFELIFLFTY